MMVRCALLQALHRQLEEPGNQQGAAVGSEQADRSRQVAAPVIAQVAIESDQIADNSSVGG